MAEELNIAKGSKEDKYKELLPQIKALVESDDNLVGNMANVAAALKQTFGFFWVGFYVVKADMLRLAPFQGPVACSKILYGKGVCGTVWKEKRTIIVPDVEQFPGHISCNSASKSEIVVPIIRNKEVKAVLDIDSDTLNSFDDIDALYLERICDLLNGWL